MKTGLKWVLAGMVFAGLCSFASAHPGMGHGRMDRGAHARHGANALVAQIVKATSRFRDVAVAEASGYQRMWGCVSNANAGAMGIHYVNADYVADPEVRPTQPEALVFEPTRHGLRLVALEYVTIAEGWDAIHPGTPPVMLNQLFFYMGAPNRFGLPSLYSLHVWAFKRNPNGLFAAWNPRVKCGAGLL